MQRMNREQFYATLAPLDEERLKKTLWTLYWRGSAQLRERIETELTPEERKPSAKSAKQTVDAQSVLDDARRFVELARAGAYMAGDRRVSPKERTRWRFTFTRLTEDAKTALAADAGTGAQALELLIDLADETCDYDYFRSEDPMAAARFVVSDAVALLWATYLDLYGFSGFAERAAPQLIRWERAYGWTRRGDGPTAEKETTLADVLARMLRGIDSWLDFTDRYLAALDRLAGGGPERRAPWRDMGFERGERARNLAGWHLMVLDRLADAEADDRLERLATHPALAGPELRDLRALLGRRRGENDTARALIRERLDELPGHTQFLDFAREIGAELPERARHMPDRLSGR
ncbi:hypothetical protein AB0O34_25290 [Sphaerisporangium sp. NPDC088356]|uniref:hypothetical protein n=1 Tax=Sphaerisporangium sp. NPDC088356 TaxID=3154871 RepID=UPI003442B084